MDNCFARKIFSSMPFHTVRSKFLDVYCTLFHYSINLCLYNPDKLLICSPPSSTLFLFKKVMRICYYKNEKLKLCYWFNLVSEDLVHDVPDVNKEFLQTKLFEELKTMCIIFSALYAFFVVDNWTQEMNFT